MYYYILKVYVSLHWLASAKTAAAVAAVAAAAISDGAACRFTHIVGFGALASITAVGATAVSSV